MSYPFSTSAVGLVDSPTMVATMSEQGLFVGYQPASDPTDIDWMKFMQITNLAYGYRHKHTLRSRALILSDGGKPNSEQRKMLDRAHEIGGAPRNDVAVVTDLIMAPTVVNLLVVLGKLKHTKFFKPADGRKALMHIGSEADLLSLSGVCQWLVSSRQSPVAKTFGAAVMKKTT